LFSTEVLRGVGSWLKDAGRGTQKIAVIADIAVIARETLGRARGRKSGGAVDHFLNTFPAGCGLVVSYRK
jgi:hypothetical protein